MKRYYWLCFLFLFAFWGLQCHPQHELFAYYSATKATASTTIDSTKAQLGRYLFYDTRLSANNTKSCATCHAPELAFSDGYRRSTGIYGDNTQHNAPSLLNLNTYTAMNWATPHLQTIAQQVVRPLLDTIPLEMGAHGNEQRIYARLATDSVYATLFPKAYPNTTQAVHFDHIVESISQFVATLQSRNSLIDQYNLSPNHLLPPEVAAGKALFEGKAGCATCHSGKDFNTPEQGSRYANLGLYNCNDGYPKEDYGIAERTQKMEDNGKYRIPSLRNVAITAPYFHDGSAATLKEVLQIYENGGRKVESGTCIGDGRNNPNRDKRLPVVKFSVEEKQQLLAFLYALTDTSYLRNKAFMNPFLW
jgi:cytochrome c peroxidase